MPLDRPPRPPAGAVTDAVRSAILRRAHQQLGLNAPMVLSLHTEAEYLADARDLLADVERRYELAGPLYVRVLLRMSGGVTRTFTYGAVAPPDVYGDEGASFILLELPDTEFLTAIEHAVALGFRKRLFGEEDELGVNVTGRHTADQFFRYADEALRSHGVRYRRAGHALRFEWVGDLKQHQLVIEPGLLALGDSRLAGARAEFDEALRKRRSGTPKDLEDAVDEAAKAVESVLKVLHAQHSVTPPRSQQLTSLFNSLVAAPLLPGYVDKLVAGAAGPRNNMASHGQGGAVRAVPEELADASIAAAATAITFLAHYLP